MRQHEGGQLLVGMPDFLSADWYIRIHPCKASQETLTTEKSGHEPHGLKPGA